jgi:hypothetical protein
MFLASFRGEERTAFLVITRKLIAADNVIAPEEIRMFEALIEEMGADGDVEIPDRSEEDACDAITNHTSQIFAMLELISVAFVDNDYAPAEKRLLGRVAKRWGIGRATLRQMEEWAEKRVGLAVAAARFVNARVAPRKKPERKTTRPVRQSSRRASNKRG